MVEVMKIMVSSFKGTHAGTAALNAPNPATENWIKDLLNMALPIRTRPSFPLSQSVPSENFHKPLIPSHQKAGRMKPTITENYSN